MQLVLVPSKFPSMVIVQSSFIVKASLLLMESDAESSMIKSIKFISNFFIFYSFLDLWLSLLLLVFLIHKLKKHIFDPCLSTNPLHHNEYVQ